MTWAGRMFRGVLGSARRSLLRLGHWLRKETPTFTRWLRKARGVPHFIRNVVVGFFKQDLRRFLFRHHGHAVRLFIFRCGETVWIALRVAAALVVGSLIVALGLLGAVCFYAYAELYEIWCPLEKGEGVHVL